MYKPLKLTKDIFEKHVKDLSSFRFSYFLSQSTTFLSRDYVKGFLVMAKNRPDCVVIADERSKKVAGLMLLYPPREEYSDGSVVVLLSASEAIDIQEFSKTIRPIINGRISKLKMFCLRSTVLAEENDQINILESLGFEKEVVMKEQAFYNAEYKDACVYTLFGDNPC